MLEDTSAEHMDVDGHTIFTVSLCESEALQQVFSTPDSLTLSLYFSYEMSLSAGLHNTNLQVLGQWMEVELVSKCQGSFTLVSCELNEYMLK